jgi:glycerophosphoryl diester phosphodiesterase
MFQLSVSQNGFVHACGHRGHSIGAPENTIAALKATQANGGTSAEIDIRLTKDGEIVLLHDDFLDRTSNGKGLLSDLTFDAVRKLDAGSWFAPSFAGERIPTLAEAADCSREAGLGLVIEIKEERQAERMIDQLVKLIEASDLAEQAVFISFDHTFLKALKDRLPRARTEGITHARHVDFVGVARAAKLDSLSIERGMFHPEDGRALHDAGVAIRVHLERPDEIARYLAVGDDIAGAVSGWIQSCVLDSVSGDDVAFLARLVADARSRSA